MAISLLQKRGNEMQRSCWEVKASHLLPSDGLGLPLVTVPTYTQAESVSGSQASAPSHTHMLAAGRLDQSALCKEHEQVRQLNASNLRTASRRALLDNQTNALPKTRQQYQTTTAAEISRDGLLNALGKLLLDDVRSREATLLTSPLACKQWCGSREPRHKQVGSDTH
jgi:hypothetical protein